MEKEAHSLNSVWRVSMGDTLWEETRNAVCTTASTTLSVQVERVLGKVWTKRPLNRRQKANTKIYWSLADGLLPLILVVARLFVHI
jgi:hypothetical protein